MSISNMKQRIKIYDPVSGVWLFRNSVWAETKEQPQRCIYSQYGSACETTTKVSTYFKNRIEQTNLIEIDGLKYIAASKQGKETRDKIELTCARVRVERCSYEKDTVTKNELNRVIHSRTEQVFFDGILADKYISTSQNDVFNTESQIFVLMVQKCVKILLGTIVTVGNEKYEIVLRHENGIFFNEYEIKKESDV